MECVQPIRDRKNKKIENMKKILKSASQRDYVMFLVGINSGLRVSDLLRLKVSDVIERGKVKDRIIIREQKTGKSKSFPISDNVSKALREYAVAVNPDGHLFPSRKGGRPITRQQAYHILNEAAKTVGISEQIGTHSLRKTFGYHAYLAGIDITRIQALLNHSSPRETLRYIGITQDELDGIYLNLNL